MKKCNKYIIYLLGIFFLSLGSVLAIKSNLGVSSVSALALNLSLITSFNIGTLSTCVFTVYVILQIIILKKDFKLIQLTQILVAILFGRLVDILNVSINFNIENIWARIILLIVALFITSFGILCTITVNIIPMPPEGLIKVISSKTGIEFGKIKVYFDCTVVGIALIVTLISGIGLGGIGLGTFLSMILVGKILSYMNIYIRDGIERIIFDSNKLNFE
ncbi:YczE/YyaS/YitT family protein [Clostridium sp.]|uniref:YczE/YyaS/YitT family protein n=1 Tax=Clostridium sp. TaxID=1506 RepID=UPI003F30BC2F